MMKVIGHTGCEVFIGHFQGNVMKKWVDVIENYSTFKVVIDPRVSVITAFTEKNKAITALQLEISNMPYVNACPIGETEWTNIDKIKYYVDALEKTTSEYTLLVDGYDVLFLRNIDEEFIRKFELIGHNVLFNATKNNYPNFEIDQIENRDLLGNFKYLNAGVAFGKTAELLKFYKEVLALTKRTDIINPWNSEQLYVRMASNGNDKVGFDYQCILFQTFSKAQRTICGGNIMIV